MVCRANSDLKALEFTNLITIAAAASAMFPTCLVRIAHNRNALWQESGRVAREVRRRERPFVDPRRAGASAVFC